MKKKGPSRTKPKKKKPTSASSPRRVLKEIRRIQRERGDAAEKRVISLLDEELEAGRISAFQRVKKGSKEDIRGCDFLFKLPQVPGIKWPLQVKSSRAGEVEFAFKGIRMDWQRIPMIVAGWEKTPEDLRQQFAEIRERCVKEAKEPSGKLLKFMATPDPEEAENLPGQAGDGDNISNP